MWKQFFSDPLSHGLAQAGLASVAAIAVMLLARTRRIHLESETLVALVRGLAQIVIVGSILAVLLRGPRWTSAFILAAMMVAAARSCGSMVASVVASRLARSSARAFSSNVVRRRLCQSMLRPGPEARALLAQFERDGTVKLDGASVRRAGKARGQIHPIPRDGIFAVPLAADCMGVPTLILARTEDEAGIS